MSKNLPDMAENYQKKHPEGGMKSEDVELLIPEVTPEPGKEGRFTNQLKYIRYNILDAFSRIPEAKFFKRPVDPAKDGLPHYFDFIKRPMDLSTIRRRILNKFYWSGKECLADLGLMFVNAYVYNQPDSGLVKCAKKLELTLLEKLLDYPKLEEEIESLAAVRVTSDRALTPLADESPGVVLRSRRASSMASSLDPDSQSMPSSIMKRSGYESESESSAEGSESSDSESSGSEGEVMNRKTAGGLKKSLLPFLQQQMNLIRQQMAVLAEIEDEKDSGPRKTSKGKGSKTTKKKAASLASEYSKSRSVSPKTPNKGKVGKGRPPQKKTKLDFGASPVDSARKKVKGLRNTDSMPHPESPPMKKTLKQEKSKIDKVVNESKYDISRPMTEEEIDNLFSDINKVSHEDMLQVIQKARIASYLPDDDAEDDDDSFPVEKFPMDKQWHVRTLIDEILENFTKKASDQPSTSESAKVTDPPFVEVGTNSDATNGEANSQSQSNAQSQEEVKEQDDVQDMLDLDYGEDDDSLNVY